MAPQPEETPVLEVIINILDNKLAGIAYSQDLPLKCFAKKHVEANTLRKARSSITEVLSLCTKAPAYTYFCKRLEYENANRNYRLKWYSGVENISKSHAAAAFVDKDIVELLSIISNCFKSVTNRCDPDFIHLEFTETDDKIWTILSENSATLSSMLAEAQQLTAPKKEEIISPPDNNISDVKASIDAKESLNENLYVWIGGTFVPMVRISKEDLNKLRSQKN